MSVVAVALQIFACLGAGAIVLRVLGLLNDLPVRERLPWAFAVGIGVLGWLVFPLALSGLATAPTFAVLEAGLALGCLLLGPAVRALAATADGLRPHGWGWLLVVIAILAVLFDLAEALAPPLDADSLAYHFARVRGIVRTGRIAFDPLAVDGVGALLIQMTYAPPLALGGEKALTLWVMASGWAGPLFLYTVARRWLAPSWSLALALILATTPAWIYGAGSGQVEPRLALFAFAGLLAATEARARNTLRYAALAGMLAGFYAAGKFFGLFFVAAAGLVVVSTRVPWRPAALFAAGAGAAGFQWYLWNYIHIGDPVFPGLFPILGVRDPGFWSADMDMFFRAAYLNAERPAGRSWLPLYPLAVAIGFGFPIWDASRTGLGPFALLAAPFILGSLWVFRARLAQGPLAGMAAGTIFFYVLWFMLGASQRVRHLLPLWPVILLCSMVAAERWAIAVGHNRVLAAAVAVVLAMQLAGGAVFATPYVRYALSTGDRSEFLARRLVSYSIVPWLNRHLTADDRLLTTERQLNYYLEMPFFYTGANKRIVPDFRDSARDIRRQWTDLRQLGISHVLLLPGLAVPSAESSVWRLGRELVRAGCAEVVVSLPVRQFHSRTLPSFGASQIPADVLRLRPEACDPKRLPQQ